MRHTIAENINVLGKFDTGDTVTISLYKISDESVVALTSNSCNEIATTSVFKWNSSNITTAPTVFTEYLWIMDNSTYTQYGKIVLGGYPDRVLKATEVKQCIITDASATSLSFTTNLTETSNQFWQRGVILITSGNNEGQMRAILNYNGSTKAITLKTPLNVAPAQNDTFIILTERKYLTADIEDIIDNVWDEPAGDHVTSGTMGEYMKKIKSWTSWLRSLL